MIADPLLDLAGHPIIGHRGAAGSAPENTLAAFDLALEQGAEALELDVRLTADGVPVVLHDATLERTTDGQGLVAATTLERLRRLDAGARFTTDATTFPWRGQGVGVPTLDEVFQRYPSTPLLIELKVAEAADPVARALLSHGAETRAVVASFLPAALTRFRKPPFLAGASRSEIAALWARATLRLPPREDQGIRLYAVPRQYKGWIRVATRRFVAGAARLGRPVHVWTVDNVARAHRLWKRGVAGIITNYPALMREARDRRFGSPGRG